MCPFLQMRIYTFMVFCLRFNYFLSQRYCKSYNKRNYFSKILYFIGKKHVFICITCDFDVICLEIVSRFLEVKEVIEVKEVKANSFCLTLIPQHYNLTLFISS